VTFRVAAPQLPPLPQISRRVRIILSVVGALIVLAILFSVFVNQYTELLWFDSVHYSSVYTRRLDVEIVMFFVAGLVMAAFVAANVVLAYRTRPHRLPEQPWESVVARARWVVLALITLIVGIPAGAAAAKRWQLWMLWRNSTSFGVKDPQFHQDVSYYAFTYPLERFILSELFVMVFLAVLGAAITSYLYGGVRAGQGRRPSATPAARAHLSVLLGLFVLLKAAAYWLDRYGLAFSPRGDVTGPSYTDVHATLPAKTILVFIAIICSLLFFANVRLRNWQLPAIAFGLMVVSAGLIGGAYPGLVQQFKVKPSAQDLEAPYIGRNIDATRAAFGIGTGDVTTTDYPGTTTSTASTVRNDADNVAQLRMLDPNIVSQTFDQLQQQRSFYSFSQPLDVDRYPLAGSTTTSGAQTASGSLQDVVVGTRNIDLSGLQPSQRNWINQHLVYTHGYGIVAAQSDQIGAQGSPDFVESNLPPTGQLSITQPRIYFGEGEPSYSIVGAPPGTERELDRPADSQAGQTNFTYTGDGGVSVGSFWRQLLYSWKLRDKNILLSSEVNSASRILYVRDPIARVQQVAPWLTLDSDTYPVVVDGQIDWVVDGYTTTNGYPYSEQESLASTTSTTTTAGESASAQGTSTVNYIRNSVKAVVNAYTGAVTLYEWNPTGGTVDPILQTWMKAFPGVVQPQSAIPADLLPHLRYPEDLFDIQRSLIAKYHVTDPKTFYNGTNFWLVPDDPTVPVPVAQPPYYLTLSPTGSTSNPVFALTSTLTSLNRRNLTADLTVDSQPGPDYGHITLLQLPATQTALAPGQVQNEIESDPTVSHNLTLLRGGGSTVTLGNLLTVPVDGTLLYVEPIYVSAAGGQSFPTLRRVVADYQGTVGYAANLTMALNKAFGTASTQPQPTPVPPNNGGGKGKGSGKNPSPPSGVSAKVQADLARALAAQARAQADLQKSPPDFSAYGKDEAALRRALAAAQRDSGGSG
jgi:uncharacterized membrane protein (UPF0182 family)